MSNPKVNNNTTKALKQLFTINNDNFSRQISGQANKGKKDLYGNITGEQLIEMCDNLHRLGGGASKIGYKINDYLAIVILDSNDWFKGFNQIKAQINLWEQLVNTEYDFLFNPVIRYGLARGDKLTPDNDKYRKRCYIVSQLAMCPHLSYIDTIKEQCKLNCITDDNEIKSIINEYTTALQKVKNQYNLRDLDSNNGNYGIIYDYAIKQYRTVFIDYGLTKNV